jgi:hypothetical protein
MQPELATIRFDAVTHRYWTGPRELLGVTHVLREAGLVDAAWYTEVARERGAALHALTEAIDRGEPTAEYIDPDSLRALAPYLDAYQRFLADAKPVWAGIETPAADLALGYAGTIDRWGTLQGDVVVIDLKTGTVPPWAPLQLVAYARLALDGRAIRRRRIVVQLLPTGRYSLREYPVANFGRDERIFLSALAIAQWKRAA